MSDHTVHIEPTPPCARGEIQITAREAAPSGTTVTGIPQQDARDWAELTVRIGADVKLDVDQRAILASAFAMLDGLTGSPVHARMVLPPVR